MAQYSAQPIKMCFHTGQNRRDVRQTNAGESKKQQQAVFSFIPWTGLLHFHSIGEKLGSEVQVAV